MALLGSMLDSGNPLEFHSDRDSCKMLVVEPTVETRIGFVLIPRNWNLDNIFISQPVTRAHLRVI